MVLYRIKKTDVNIGFFYMNFYVKLVSYQLDIEMTFLD